MSQSIRMFLAGLLLATFVSVGLNGWAIDEVTLIITGVIGSLLSLGLAAIFRQDAAHRRIQDAYINMLQRQADGRAEHIAHLDSEQRND